MDRRTFLHRTAHAMALPTLMGSFGFSTYGSLKSLLRATQEADRVLVLIYLQGGNDGLNTVVPLDQLSALNKIRPHVILPEKKLLNIPGTELAFHPELDGFRSLYTEGKLKIVQSVGYPDQNYSHFRSTDIWMSGSDSNVLVGSGWPGRYLNYAHPEYPDNYPNDSFSDPLSIEIGYGSSMLFQGPANSMSMVINDPTSFHQLLDNEEEEVPNSYAGEKLRHIRLTARQSQLYGEVVKEAANKVNFQKEYPDDNELAQKLKIVARLIAGGLRTPLYMVQLGSFDTHDAQVLDSDHTKGEHASLLGQLNGAVMSFMNDLEYHGVDDKVVGMTFSEFGRRIVSNASLGTDHGSAAPLFVFGNQVKSGVIGDNPVIPSDTTYKDNLPYQYDFRQVYASLLEQWYGVPEADRGNILMNDFSTLSIIGEESVTSTRPESSGRELIVYPNPLKDRATIEFISYGKAVNIKAIDMAGRAVNEIYAGVMPSGKQSVHWDTSGLPAGNYYVVIQSEDIRRAVSVMKVK